MLPITVGGRPPGLPQVLLRSGKGQTGRSAAHELYLWYNTFNDNELHHILRLEIEPAAHSISSPGYLTISGAGCSFMIGNFDPAATVSIGIIEHSVFEPRNEGEV